MLETLFIRLGSKAHDPIQWLIWSNPENEVIASGDLSHASDLSHLTEKAAQRKVVGFVPASEIALKRLKVPGKSSRAITAAAPYMLEDELAQDVESLFFAYANLAKDQDDNNCFAAAVDREQLARWLLWLEEAGIKCKTLIPDVLALPFNEGEWSAVTLNNQILLRQGLWQAAAVESNVWALISQQWASQNQAVLESENDSETESDELTSSASISINAYAQLPESPGITINAMPEELPLALLAQHVDLKFFNLLQGEFQVKDKRSANYSNWLWVASIAGIALVMNVALKGAELVKLNNQNAAIETEIIKVYKDAFPETKKVRISTIKSQLNRKLSEVGGSSSQADFLTMLNSVQPAFSEVTALKPESMKYDAKRSELRIQAISKDYQSFEKLKIGLEKQSLNVNQGAQNNLGDQVSGSFVITSKGSR
ncbi:type II secretion system protein GspL [Pseudocolwellia agarivorans]|jgi:general secretion pathway protein L|uniref:type II secretion system protein GspL n=1 Tax=Pseudocolwellia agarivorans TaxID=1911682 RepID=UPI003F883637